MHSLRISWAQQVRYNHGHAYDQPLADHPTQRRYIREILLGHRRWVRYSQITKGSTENPDPADSWWVMTHLPGNIILSVGLQYTWRAWIEYGFKQVKNELDWHDYRLTDYQSIERWWELIFKCVSSRQSPCRTLQAASTKQRWGYRDSCTISI